MALPLARPRFTFLAAALLPATLFACSGPATTTRTTPTTTPLASASTPQVLDDAPDMSPVAKPSNVFLTARFASVGKTVDTLDKLVKLPKTLRAELDLALERRSATFVDLSGSVDVGVALDSNSKGDDVRPLVVVSLPIKSPEDATTAAKKMGADVSASGPHAWHLRAKGFVCDVAPSLGESQYRIVCSDRESGLEALGPWMVRGFAAEPKPTADAWARLDVAPFRAKFLSGVRGEADEAAARFSKQISRVLPKADKEVLDAPGVIESELFALADDVDYLQGSLTIDGSKPSFTLDFDAHFASKTSWVAGLVDETASSGTAPPELFYRLPKDATTAFYGHSSDPAKFAGIRRVVHKGLSAALDALGSKAKMSDADKSALLAWVDGIPTVSGMWVSASGHATQKALPEKGLTAQQAIDGFKAEVQGILPWSISGGDGDPAASITWLTLTQDAITKAVADLKAVAGKDAAKLTFLPVAKVTKDPAGYPKGSAELTITVSVTSTQIWQLLPQNKGVDHPKGAEAKGDVVLHIVVVPDDAGHFWWGYAFDGDALKAHVNAALKSAPATGQLSARTDLDALKSHKGFGGFISLGGGLEAIAPLMRHDGENLKRALEVVPHKFAGNVFVLGSGTAGAAPSVSIGVTLGKDWVEDLAALARAMVK
ncbi:MAG: hypothetical protein U0414_12525 [Polyangiaceae bacterium]